VITAPLWALKALGFLRAVPWQAWALAALCALVLALRWHWIGVGEDRVQTAWDQQEAVYAAEREAAELAARNTEARHRAEYKAIAGRFLAEQEKADEEHAAVVAGLRAGSIRVRERLTCPRVPDAAGSAEGTDGAGPRGFTERDAEVALGIAARADEIARRLNALQEAVRAGQRQ